MKFGLPISFAAHAVFGLAGLIVFGSNLAPAPQARIIPVELFTVSDITNVRAAIKAPDEAPAQSEVEPAPVVKPPQPDPEPEPLVVDPEPSPEQLLPPEQLAEVEPEPEPEPEKVAELEPELTPEPETTAEPEIVTPKPLSLDDLQKLADLAKTDRSETPDERLLTTERNRIEQAAANRAQVGAGTGLSTSYEDAIMRKVYENWQIPAGAPDMENLIVKIRVSLAADGRIEQAELSPESRSRMRGDRFYTAAAESALRAVNGAARFAFLPREQYETWRNLTLTFYPKDAPFIVPI